MNFTKILIYLINEGIYTVLRKVYGKWHGIRYLVDLGWCLGSIFTSGMTYGKIFNLFMQKFFHLTQKEK